MYLELVNSVVTRPIDPDVSTGAILKSRLVGNAIGSRVGYPAHRNSGCIVKCTQGVR